MLGRRLLTLLVAAFSVTSPARADVVVEVGDVRVERAPFRIAVGDALATADGGAPVRAPGVDGPQPEEPLGALGGFPALGWVVGARASSTIPVFLWAGNRLFGAETGALVTVTDAELVERTTSGARLRLMTTAGAPADAELTRLPGGGARLRVTPPESPGGA